ncbi:VOC family protein [Aliiglaciecola sp. 3_MG-2023]|uniref:VOC family protein n=1 Tax=Aliiglaciecola TaxID=1406885 RepID=UPI001C08B962|nr:MULTISPECIES: VOC family protein [Aliiglaciecola]MBU2878364.1 VOC family protein [Aliiglaciecola lipolytica]MDO6694649.1 VOC family protein [Aliiglaciecola sp. 3_MG-2023]
MSFVPPINPQAALAYDHVGIRVSNRQTAIHFYERLGFKETYRIPEGEANEMVTSAGVRINLIFNGAKSKEQKNVLLDEPIKRPGVTHPAFIINDMSEFQAWLAKEGIMITEGPKRLGPRRISLFIRDPDGNVLEFNQLLPEEGNNETI